MNDILYVYLNFDPDNRDEAEKVEKILPRIDALMKDNGWQYTGLQNIYRPIEGTDCDETCYRVEEAIKNADWLKEYKPYCRIGVWTNACDIGKIIIQDMKPVPEEKMKRYTDYFREKNKYVHAIVVDENHVLRDGYTTYLLAKENHNERPNVIQVCSGQIFKKVVIGKIDGEDKYGIWYYEIDPAVIPGDILLVETEQGPKEICVEKIAYLAGPHYCSVHQHVLEHRCNAEQVGA